MSSKDVLVPLLKDWRIYDGNIRAALAKHKGILRDDDLVRLDSHAKTEAENILREIQDPEIQGKWKPEQVGKKAKRSKKNEPTKPATKKGNDAASPSE